MDTIIFGNYDYSLLPSGYGLMDDKLNISIFANELELTAVEEVVRNKNNVETIMVVNENEEIIQIFREYQVLNSIKKEFDYIYNSYYNEEGYLVEEKTNVIFITLAKPGLKEQTDKNTADIEYIAIIEDIEL